MRNHVDTGNKTEAFLKGKEMEMMPNELMQLLETELAKPAESIDAARVARILELLGEAEPAEAQREEIWRRVQEKLDRQKRSARIAALSRRAAVVLLALILAAAALWGTARAFHWPSLLMQWLPAETFGIKFTEQTPEEGAADAAVHYVEDNTDTEFLVYERLEDVPAVVEGYPITPGWLPEGYAFQFGSVYRDENMEMYTLRFGRGDEAIEVVINIFSDQANFLGYQYEHEEEIPLKMAIRDRDVTVYINAESGETLVYWIQDEKCQYFISGRLTEEEIAAAVGGLQ